MGLGLLVLCCLPCVVSVVHEIQYDGKKYTLGAPDDQIQNITSAAECQTLCTDSAGCSVAMHTANTCNLFSGCPELLKPVSPELLKPKYNCPGVTDREMERTDSGRYVIYHVTNGMTFDEGFCKCLSSGGHMLAIESQVEQDEIVVLLQNQLETYSRCVRTWTGGQAEPAGGKNYYWNMTDTLCDMTDYEHWVSTDPQGGQDLYLALAKLKNYEWADFKPDSEWNPDCVICEIET